MVKFLCWALIISVTVYGGCISKPAKKYWAEDEAREVADTHARETPHIVRDSGDGCKVYAFSTGDTTHFFTRCSPGEQVSTDRNYTERQGKKTVNKTETIVTQE